MRLPKLIGRGAWAVVGLWLLSLFGCATVPATPIRDGEAQAVAIAWRVYGRSDLPPVVRWKQGSQLTCTDPNSGKAGFHIPDPDEGTVCREGLTMSFMECWVAWHGEASFADTALPHELLHVAQARRMFFDPHHESSDWSTLLPVAGQAIRDAGL